MKISLADIDTPERDQPYGREATKLLARLAYDRILCATTITVDRYGRTVAHLYDGEDWINLELVADGAAWVYRKYAKAPYRQPLLKAEASAREAGRGLWEASNPLPQWEWCRR
ncbi:MAG: thermonuclease family protein [Gammaproteobacteria bacterium]|nr:thermonuclease family protein [Gammaproteobacteria bacterium]